MCKVSRRELIIGGTSVLGLTAIEAKSMTRGNREVGKVDLVSDGVYFHEGNIAVGHCNNGWIIFEDYVLVIDANFPSGAKEIIPKIRALTDKPIRFAFDTHHHGDHAYGNQVWVENGATPVAHTGVIEEMKKYEPGRWNDSAKERPDVRESKLKHPSVLFPRELYFDDGKRRVELHHLGVAHTHGDAVAWLPREKVLFTGDVCVNGPFNYVGDGHVEKWIATLDLAKKLGATVVCPGHGVRAGATLLDDQQLYFNRIRAEVSALVSAKKAPEDVSKSIDSLSNSIKSNKRIERYVGSSFAAHVEKVYEELTGTKLPRAQRAAIDARRHHSHEHGYAA
jgi:cyclase